MQLTADIVGFGLIAVVAIMAALPSIVKRWG